MFGRAFFKRIGAFAAWDLDKGCRRIVNQSTDSNRRLKRKLKRQERERLKRELSKRADD